MKKILVLLALQTTLYGFSAGETKITQQEYVAQWKSIAVAQMISYRIPASITMAQGILESGYGNSVLAQKGNNHFGIKCHDWKGEKIYVDDDKKDECFRSYANARESFEDHSTFLTSRTRYDKLFTYDVTDYKKWAHGLKEAGYATNPKYPQLLIDLIERLKLNELDKQGALNSNPTDYITESKVTNQSKSETNTASAHTVKLHANKVKYVVAKKGDTFYRLSKEFSMALWQLQKYNDFGPKKEFLEEGDIVYIQPKRMKSKGKKEFAVTAPTTLRMISQLEGIRLNSLMDKNTISSPDELLQKGEKILLK